MKVIDIPSTGSLRVRFVDDADAWVPDNGDYLAEALRRDRADELVQVRLAGDLAFRLLKIYEQIGSLLDRDFQLQWYDPDAPLPDWADWGPERHPHMSSLGNPLGLSDDEIIAAFLP